ncbi:ubinuclein-1-like isoform X1 [Camellia sinensis]|uniref:ubinuclein-1-like isoform X1 n=1 Tax=Camellia sinensis TaxID=4442 RepID=UPI001036A7C1|nr:ubinuclein-1-like isoform X1 [Camellia sinensis]
MQKAPVMQIKEGLNVRPKCTMLEKAIRELEKMVAESRPPTMEVQDADISSQAVKRRLPHEVKQKLAKVARLAQANHGKISMELVNRLMSIVGRMVQLRTLEIEQGILDLLALDSISGGGHANVNLFPNVDSSWKVCKRTLLYDCSCSHTSFAIFSIISFHVLYIFVTNCGMLLL